MSVNIVKRELSGPVIILVPLSSNPLFNICFEVMNRTPSALPSDMTLGSVSVAWQKALSEEGASLQDGKRTPPVLCPSAPIDPQRSPFCGPLNLDTTHSWRETTAQLPTCQELQARYWPRQTSQPLCHPVGSDYAFSNKAWTTVLGKVSSFQVCHSLETLSALQYYSSEFFCIFMVTVYYSLVLL